jgi:transposase
VSDLSPQDLSDLSREELVCLVADLRELVVAQAKRIDELEKLLGLGDDAPASRKPPSERKPHKPDTPTNKRKKRTLHFCRRRDEPTQIVDHKPTQCPDCGRALSGGSPAVRRQVIDLPTVSVSVIEHVRWDRWCGVCKKRVRAHADLSGQAFGKRRFGPNLTALVTNLHIQARIPVRTIKSLLYNLFGLTISMGAIVGLLREVSRRGQVEVAAIAEAARTAKQLHCDETGWRENGEYRCMWALATETERYYHIDERRTAQVAQDLIGTLTDRTLITDFFASYNRIACRHQRCWAHFKRDLDKLLELHQHDPTLVAWVQTVVGVWREGRAFRDFCRGRPQFGADTFDRRRKRRELEHRLYALAEPYLEADSSLVPQATLARRIGMFLGEMLTFVEYPDVPDDNNAAERAIRHPVILRKICGGTRSTCGTKVKANLMTLFGTWNVRNLNPIQQCKALVTAPSI